MDAPNLDLDTAGEPSRGLHLLRPDRSDRLFLENNPSISIGPSITRRIFRASARFLFAVLVGVGGTLAWQSYGDQAPGMIRAWAPSLAELLPISTSKQAASPVVAEDPQQLKAIAIDLAAVRHTIEQLAANQDHLTRTQEQMAQNIAALQAAGQALSQKLSSPPPPKPVHAPPPKPVQQPAQLSAQGSPKPNPPPQSLQPPKQ